jgi:hypothetical protein
LATGSGASSCARCLLTAWRILMERHGSGACAESFRDGSGRARGVTRSLPRPL